MIMKTTKEMIEVMQAYEIGDKIEVRYLYDHKDYWISCGTPVWDWNNFDYRVKQKKSYVPFETADEFLAAQRKHGEVIVDNVSGEKSNAYVNKNGTVVSTKLISNVWTIGCLGTIFRYYKFSDGTPCGKEVKS